MARYSTGTNRYTTSLAFLLLIFAMALIPVAQGQSQAYTIALEGGRWNTQTITVDVPTTPAWAHDAVADALTIWVQGQLWFKVTYFPNGGTYDFATSTHDDNSTRSQVNIEFVDSNESSVGRTDMKYLSISRNITSITVTLPRSYNGQELDMTQRAWFARLSIHMIGHVLGLDDLNEICDIMQAIDPACSASLPSTLDLFALHILAAGTVPFNVTLPSGIPYETMPKASGDSSPFLVVVLIVSLAFIFFGAACLRAPKKKVTTQPLAGSI